ncbi:Mating-type protein MAT-1 [Erysiphe necator]|uniref:Alpha box mating-type protein MAT1-1-1 n=1 Tax=Uncinula necator TaxID=52586 RepID=F4ZNH2_UNCNE|nr:alpha box mating-type protein MAT1-1-1 [Erysiphe necator]KAI6247692.1 Mating-type protein MAT-1 [Erysiphe necator]
MSSGDDVQFLNTFMGSPQFSYSRWVRKRSTARTNKPVNSWIGFRTFYKKIFPGMPQKEASIHLKALWEQDPFKIKWTIISAAYSKIRDIVTKKDAPLDEFLNLVCPRIGILSVDEYLPQLNWISSVNEDGIIVYKQNKMPNLSNLPENILNTRMTDKDVVRFCAEKGFIDRSTTRKIKDAHPFIELGAIKSYFMTTQGQIPILPTEIGVNNDNSNQLEQDDCDVFYNLDSSILKISDPTKEQRSDQSIESNQDILKDNSFDYEDFFPKEISEYDIPDISYQLFLDNIC